MSNQVVVAGFPITGDITLKARREHLDVRYEISNHGRQESIYGDDARGTWCYYVIVEEQALAPEDFAEFWLDPSSINERGNGLKYPCYDYWSPKFSAAEWHGGVTYYEKFADVDGNYRHVKIGCDFAHYWDQGREFDFSQVQREAIATIEALRSMYEFKRRCAWSGKWLRESDMKELNGRLVSPERFAEYEREQAAKAEGGAA